MHLLVLKPKLLHTMISTESNQPKRLAGQMVFILKPMNIILVQGISLSKMVFRTVTMTKTMFMRSPRFLMAILMNTDGMGSQEVERNAPGEGMGGRTLTTEKKECLTERLRVDAQRAERIYNGGER